MLLNFIVYACKMGTRLILFSKVSFLPSFLFFLRIKPGFLYMLAKCSPTELQPQPLFFFFFLVALGLELRAYTLSHSTNPIFMLDIFEIGTCELFAQAVFKL
jgi:hypothetical protein